MYGGPDKDCGKMNGTWIGRDKRKERIMDQTKETNKMGNEKSGKQNEMLW